MEEDDVTKKKFLHENPPSGFKNDDYSFIFTLANKFTYSKKRLNESGLLATYTSPSHMPCFGFSDITITDEDSYSTARFNEEICDDFQVKDRSSIFPVQNTFLANSKFTSFSKENGSLIPDIYREERKSCTCRAKCKSNQFIVSQLEVHLIERFDGTKITEFERDDFYKCIFKL